MRDYTELSLTSALSSTTSAKAYTSLFGGFIGTTALCDSSAACLSDLWLSPSRTGPDSLGKPPEASRFSNIQFLSVPGVYDYAGPLAGSR